MADVAGGGCSGRGVVVCGGAVLAGGAASGFASGGAAAKTAGVGEGAGAAAGGLTSADSALTAATGFTGGGTGVGATGVFSIAGSVFLAASGAEWEELLGRLLEDAALRRSLGEAGRKTVESRYSAVIQAPRVAAIFKGLRG